MTSALLLRVGEAVECARELVGGEGRGGQRGRGLGPQAGEEGVEVAPSR